MLFFILIFVLIAILIANPPTTKSKNQCEKIHKWVLRDVPDSKKGYLVCRVCGKVPLDD